MKKDNNIKKGLIAPLFSKTSAQLINGAVAILGEQHYRYTVLSNKDELINSSELVGDNDLYPYVSKKEYYGDLRQQILEEVATKKYDILLLSDEHFYNDDCICKQKKSLDFLNQIDIPVFVIPVDTNNDKVKRVLIVSDADANKKSEELSLIKDITKKHHSSIYNLNISAKTEPAFNEIAFANQLKEYFYNYSFYQFHIKEGDAEYDVVNYANDNVIDIVVIMNTQKKLMLNWIEQYTNSNIRKNSSSSIVIFP